ncbi:MAG TPA: response regulator [Steroidobacteraceae bacterium]|nr:response regulator [Steroidobacteraceae bacterium]
MARILLADDDTRVREAVAAILEDAGHEVLQALDGDHALKSFRARPVDVVVCDLFMPGKDGLETIQELRKLAPGVKILAMSGSGFNGAVDMLRTALHLGAIEVLGKPVRRKHLLAAVDRLLEKARG